MAETGLPKTCFAVDPGIGFGKSVPENLALMREREHFFDGGAAVLLAVAAAFGGALWAIGLAAGGGGGYVWENRYRMIATGAWFI